jgi:hypothetical protein
MRGHLYVPATLYFGKRPLVAIECEGGPES